MEKIRFQICEKELTLYTAQGENRPLIAFNTVMGDCFAWVASMSLGDAEAKTKHAVLKTVQENTEAIVRHYQEVGVDVRWELNPGNHFRDVAMRSAKGIKAILEA